jgi:hypothetical protein
MEPAPTPDAPLPPEASAAVGELLDALRRRRRWSLVLVLAPLLTAGAIVGAFEVRSEALALPIGVVGSLVALVALVGAIEAGLAATHAMRSVGSFLPPKAPGDSGR